MRWLMTCLLAAVLACGDDDSSFDGPAADAVAGDAPGPDGFVGCDGTEDCAPGYCCGGVASSTCVASFSDCAIVLCNDGADCPGGFCCPQGFCGEAGCD